MQRSYESYHQMKKRYEPVLSGLPLIGMLAILFFSGCGATVTVSTPAATLTPSASPTPTVPPITAAQISACFGSAVLPTLVTQIGDIAFTDQLGPLAYPARTLPDNATAPYKLTGDPATNFAPSFNGDAIPFGAKNPYASGFFMQVCNLSTTSSHQLSGVGTHITFFKPFTGQLNLWVPLPCFTSYLSNITYLAVPEGGCGGAVGPTDLQVAAVFPAGSVSNASVEGTATGGGPFPLTLAPAKTISIVLSITLANTPGIYILAPTVKIDGGVSVSGAQSSPYTYAPVARVWDGYGCMVKSYNVMIPPAPPTANFICPKAM